MNAIQQTVAVILSEQIMELQRMLGSCLHVEQNGSPWPKEAMTKGCARMSASISLLVHAGMIDFEMHDALAPVLQREMGNARGLNITENPPPKPKEGL